MTDQPCPITIDEMSALLETLCPLPAEAATSELIGWHEARARLLSDNARVLGIPNAHAIAANAWHRAFVAANRLHEQEDTR
jgi:hypothetical protein